MKHASLALLAGLMVMACAPTSEPRPETTTPAPGAEAPPSAAPAYEPEDACGAAKYANLIGKPITEPGVPAASPDVRHIRPDSQVTMDFRPDRLNIDIDANGTITGFRCG